MSTSVRTICLSPPRAISEWGSASRRTPSTSSTAPTPDYAGVGPVYATPTKAGRAPTGLDYVRYAAGSAHVPWFAIGGIDETNVRDVVKRRRSAHRSRPSDRRCGRSERTAAALRAALKPDSRIAV
jgi:hypothetical protein